MTRSFKSGGIILYDDTGIWIIKEHHGWNFPGGHKEDKDKDIYHTMAREFNEETYDSFPITPEIIKTLAKTCSHIYYPFKRNYLYIMIHVDDLPFQFSLKKYNKNIKTRKLTESTKFMHVTTEQIIDLFESMHIRLQRLLLSRDVPFSIKNLHDLNNDFLSKLFTNSVQYNVLNGMNKIVNITKIKVSI